MNKSFSSVFTPSSDVVGLSSSALSTDEYINKKTEEKYKQSKCAVVGWLSFIGIESMDPQVFDALYYVSYSCKDTPCNKHTWP